MPWVLQTHTTASQPEESTQASDEELESALGPEDAAAYEEEVIPQSSCWVQA